VDDIDVVSFVVGRFTYPQNDLVAAEPKAVEVSAITVDDVLTRSGVTRLKLVSIDVQFMSLKCYADLSINRWLVRLAERTYALFR